MKTLKSSIYGVVLSLLLSNNVVADCSFELFNISSTKGTKIIDFVEQLSDECEFTVLVNDPNAKEFLETTLSKTHIKNLTIDEVLNLVLTENNLSYTLENNVLKISYLTTKVFSMDYILSQRKSMGSTDVTLSSSTDAKTSGSSDNTTNNAESGIKIESNDEVKFWEELDTELQNVLNRPHDSYVANAPLINKNAGLITVTCTVKQMKRLEDYLTQLQNKVQLQVLIDVQILSVTMSDKKSTGIDWSQLYALQNFKITADTLYAQNVSKFTDSAITEGLYPDPITGRNAATTNALFKASADVSLKEVIKFLKTQGDVVAVSNPKVLTLNNQPALITVGTEHFYKIVKTETLTSGAANTQSEGEQVKSVFAGVLLDITPEISDDKTITLKINPSLSETTTDISSEDNSNRKMPPDLNRRQLSSVVTVKDGHRIILGGLINTKNTMDENKVPFLGDIPIFGYAFKHEESAKTTQELVIIIEPHIINKRSNNISLKDLGYKGVDSSYMKSKASISSKQANIDVNSSKTISDEVK